MTNLDVYSSEHRNVAVFVGEVHVLKLNSGRAFSRW
jgi:hypothetical protein